jgi:hypothetical protein
LAEVRRRFGAARRLRDAARRLRTGFFRADVLRLRERHAFLAAALRFLDFAATVFLLGLVAVFRRFAAARRLRVAAAFFAAADRFAAFRLRVAAAFFAPAFAFVFFSSLLPCYFFPSCAWLSQLGEVYAQR